MTNANLAQLNIYFDVTNNDFLIINKIFFECTKKMILKNPE